MQRNVITASSFTEADDHVAYWLHKTPLERLNAACFIINNLFSVSADTRMQKKLLTPRKHSSGRFKEKAEIEALTKKKDDS